MYSARPAQRAAGCDFGHVAGEFPFAGAFRDTFKLSPQCFGAKESRVCRGDLVAVEGSKPLREER